MQSIKTYTNIDTSFQVIHRTFLPLVGGSGKQLPPDLAPRLLHRFSSREGYSLVPGVSSLLPSLKHAAESNNGSHRVTVGVITNSDGRVPDILSSLGLRVSPLRFQEGIQATAQSTGDSQYDIDFHCMSYDVGFAKPDREIFDAAEAMANALVAAQHDASSTQTRTEGQPWTKVYVGDEFEKDVKGAWEAGWNAVFTGSEADISQIKPVDLEQLGSTALDDQFPTVDPPRMARADSIQLFLEWLIKQQTMA